MIRVYPSLILILRGGLAVGRDFCISFKDNWRVLSLLFLRLRVVSCKKMFYFSVFDSKNNGASFL